MSRLADYAIRSLLGVLSLGVLFMASQVVLPVEEVVVAGNQHLSAEEVLETTGLKAGTPWLWAAPRNLQTLLANPWVKNARLEKPAPGQLRIKLYERKQIATLRSADGDLGLAFDGMLLPGAPRLPPLIEGTGKPPVKDLVQLVKLFPGATTIRFSSAGFRIEGPSLKVWGANVKELQRWAKEHKMDTSAAVHVYPWGESESR